MPHALHAPRAGAFNIPKYQTYPNVSFTGFAITTVSKHVETMKTQNPSYIQKHTHTNCAFDAKTSWHLKFEIYIISYYFYVWTAAFPLWYFNVLHIFVWRIDTSTNCIIWYHLDIIWTLWVRSIANSLQHVPCALPCTSAARLRPMGPSVASRLCIASLRVLRCSATKLRYNMSPLSLSEGTYFLWACLMELRNHNLKQGCKEAIVHILYHTVTYTCMCFMFCSPPKYCKKQNSSKPW